MALWVIAGWILFEAYHRTFSETIEVDGLPVLIVGFGGLIINILAAKVLHSSSEHSMNVEGALQHVIADMLGSMAVVISAVFILVFHRADSADAFLGINWMLADPILSVVIAFLIAWNSRHLIKSVMVVLLEGVPEHIDVYKLCSDIEDIPGVTVIHDVHVWTITSGSEAFTAHVLIGPRAFRHPRAARGDQAARPRPVRHIARDRAAGLHGGELPGGEPPRGAPADGVPRGLAVVDLQSAPTPVRVEFSHAEGAIGEVCYVRLC